MEPLSQAIFDYYRHYYKDTLGIPNWWQLCRDRITEESMESARVDRLEKIVGSLRGKSILSVGCGTGGFAIIANERGAIVDGTDPDERAIAIAQQKAKNHGLDPQRFKVGIAERLPYPDHAFDLVHCFTVLEHVQSVEKTLQEMLRVCKNNGLLYINSPNYLHAYEGHYKLFFPPLLPKSLGRLYLRMRGRPSAFLNTINYLTPRWIQRIVKVHNLTYEDYSESGALMPKSSLFARMNFAVEKFFHIHPHIECVIRKKRL